MNKLTYIAIGALSFTAGWFASDLDWKKSADIANEDVLATVGNVTIGVKDFMQLMESKGGHVAGQYQSLDQKKRLLEYMINQEVLMKAATAKEVHLNPVVQDLYKKTVVDLYLEKELKPKLLALKVSPAELEQKAAEKQAVLKKPEKRRGAIIFKAKSDDEKTNQALKLALQEVIKELDMDNEKVRHFGPLATSHSDDQASKYQGGVIGWLINHPERQYKWPQEITDQLFQLKQLGEVSSVVETEKGFYLVRLVDLVEERAVVKNHANQALKNQLLSSKRKQLKIDFLKQLTDAAEVQVNEQALVKIDALTKQQKKQKTKPPALPRLSGE